MAGGVIKDEGDFNAEPNVIPLVDIMLVLMIIFIITIPVMTHAVKLDLPRATNKPTVTQPEASSSGRRCRTWRMVAPRRATPSSSAAARSP